MYIFKPIQLNQYRKKLERGKKRIGNMGEKRFMGKNGSQKINKGRSWK